MRVASHGVGVSGRSRSSQDDAAHGTLPPYDGVAPRQCPPPPVDASFGRVEESYRGEIDGGPESRTRATLMAVALALVGLLIGYATYHSSSYGAALGFALACATALVAVPFAPSMLRRRRRLLLTSSHLLVREGFGWRAVEWADLASARFVRPGGRTRGVPGRADIRDWELQLLGEDGRLRTRLSGANWGYDVLMRVAALFGSVRVADQAVTDPFEVVEQPPTAAQLTGLATVRASTDAHRASEVGEPAGHPEDDLVGPGAAEREIYRTRREKREARVTAPSRSEIVAGWVGRAIAWVTGLRGDLTTAYGGPRQLVEAVIWLVCVAFLVAVFLGGTMSTFSMNPFSRW